MDIKICDKYILRKCDICARDVYNTYYFDGLCFECIKLHKTIREKTCWDFIREYLGVLF